MQLSDDNLREKRIQILRKRQNGSVRCLSLANQLLNKLAEERTKLTELQEKNQFHFRRICSDTAARIYVRL